MGLRHDASRWRLLSLVTAGVLLLTDGWAVAATRGEPMPGKMQDAERLSLVPTGPERTLPGRLLGASAEPLIEHLIDNPAKVAIARAMQLAYVRFPGGSQSNYYNWRTGLLDITEKQESSAYVKFWARIAPKIHRAFSRGVTMHDYRPFAASIGAEVILVPNLETSSVAEQTAWFRQLQAESDLPTHIELGNEFYLGMLNDPDSMRRWPDLPATMAVMRAYTQALRPLCPAGTKFAVQAAGGEFHGIQPSQAIRPFQRRQAAWDSGLKPESWFEAVTIHLYPDSVTTLGYPHGATPALTDTFRARLFAALLGRVDAGTDRALDQLAARLPGKEIWITEWNPRGGNPDFSYDPVTPSMNLHLTARMTLAILRHPEVTAALFFMLNFAPDRPFSLYQPDGHGGFQPTGTAIALRWFNEAATGGASFQRYVEQAAEPVAGGGVLQESYRENEAGMFRQKGGGTLIIQNVSPRLRVVNPTQASPPRLTPDRVEILAMADLFDVTRIAPPVRTPSLAGDIALPPYSLARIIWRDSGQK